MDYTERDYDTAIAQIRALVHGERDLIANLANIAAILKQLPGYFWVGFYLVQDEELVLGPFQGPVACTRIKKGKGVCGSAWQRNETILVPDVHQFPGHIACNEASRSEVVVPVRNRAGEVLMVLDADSDQLHAFGPKDAAMLEDVCAIISSTTEV